jgi:peptidoglycan/xylan/chitin deacetylase (PgdA/CDA1 family)
MASTRDAKSFGQGEHSRDLVGYAGKPPVVAWPNGARLAVSIAIDFEEGAERNPLEGDATSEAGDPESMSEGAVGELGIRSLQAESIWEYGPRRGAWRLLRILEANRTPATFFAAAQAMERNAPLVQEIVKQGHEVAGRGYRLLPYYSLSEEEERADIRRAIEVIRRLTGTAPVGWRSRAPSERTRRLLIEAGTFRYDSDFAGDDLPAVVTSSSPPYALVPYSVETSDQGYWSLSGAPGFTRPTDFGDVLVRCFDRLYMESAACPRMMSVGLRLRISGRPSRAGQLERFIRHANGHRGVWFARRDQIAKWWIEHSGANLATSSVT